MITARLKDVVENVPEGVARKLARVPFPWRLGRAYSRAQKDIVQTQALDDKSVCSTTFQRLKTLVQHAFENVPFYRALYTREGFDPGDLKCLADWTRVPIVTKEAMQAASLNTRLAPSRKGFEMNTGGTSGRPLQFILERSAWAVEWAHMHAIWSGRGYDPRHAKLTFRGKHFDRGTPIRYNAVHNEYLVNSNSDLDAVCDSLQSVMARQPIKWIHGYPSLVADFAHVIAGRPLLLASLRSQLLGILLGSEFPAPVYRSIIEGTLSCNVVSWYGHSEMAVLARETSRGVYESYPTYGHAEAVAIDELSAEQRLVCTSLNNFVHPFIRYDTGDVVVEQPSVYGGLAFRVVHGRVGDFVLDRQGRRLSLTSIVFGRHHKAFEAVKHVQIAQECPGAMIVLVVPNGDCASINDLASLFDFSGLDLDWSIELIESPVRTESGKVKLKVANRPV